MQNFAFANIGIRKKAIGSFGVGPILTGERNSTTYRARHLCHQLSQTATKPHIAET
ncbi:hypothetical protein MOK15_19065 [Sphingobium sp. BYY-5]|uniref:hypothetical protein n=1 Tax=Sphingobium sp. BYY-5 TaxID=2926400 RepID=UPI001FA7EB6B|nr:hypothetical protein [Sphingobium sp. BYY-5]MCI4592187.1 hypothetical protein [Sphingobium sp. BYY-5]